MDDLVLVPGWQASILRVIVLLYFFEFIVLHSYRPTALEFFDLASQGLSEDLVSEADSDYGYFVFVYFSQ